MSDKLKEPMFMNWWSEDFLGVRSRKEFDECIEDHSIPLDHYGNIEDMTVTKQFEKGRRIEDIAEDFRMGKGEIVYRIRASMRRMTKMLNEKVETYKVLPAIEEANRDS